MMTPETKAKISRAMTGRQLSDEHKAAIAAAKLGKPRPPEVRAKIAATLTNRPDLRGPKGVTARLTAAEEADYRAIVRKGFRRAEALEMIGRRDLVGKSR